MQVTLAKALVVKNRLVSDLTTLRTKIKGSNTASFQVADPAVGFNPAFKYNISELLKEYDIVQEKLINTKLAIALANKDRQQQTRIFTISELKSSIAMFKELSCNESSDINRYSKTLMYDVVKVQMSEQTRDEVVKDIQSKIDILQEEMEKFNWNTMVEIPD